MTAAYILPTTTSRDSRWRKWTCKGCGFTVEGTTSLYLMHKWWNYGHAAEHTYQMAQAV